jgi:hypothetical protein
MTEQKKLEEIYRAALNGHHDRLTASITEGKKPERDRVIDEAMAEHRRQYPDSKLKNDELRMKFQEIGKKIGSGSPHGSELGALHQTQQGLRDRGRV